jgi:predicted nucleic acid-binding Zn ribbon protein
MEQLGNIIRKTLKELGIEKPIQQYEALQIWPRIAGEKISSVTEPRHIANGKLFIKVKNAAWRNELVFHRLELLKKINQQLGHSVIKEIVLI